MTHKEGIRLLHSNRNLANRLVVVKTNRKYAIPRACNVCRRFHELKHYHLQLDGQAATIVSKGVFKGLREIGMAGFQIESSVNNPPAQRIEVARA